MHYLSSKINKTKNKLSTQVRYIDNILYALESHAKRVALLVWLGRSCRAVRRGAQAGSLTK